MTRDLRVCFIGDSFVAGTGDPEHLGWPGRLAARTHEGEALSCYNLGVRRETSQQVLDRWENEVSARLPAGVDGRIVVSFGVNDMTIECGQQRVATLESAENLRTLIRGARSRGWPVMVVGPPPIPDASHNARSAELDEHMRRVCLEEGTTFISVLSALTSSPVWRRQVAMGDGAHPAADGYAVLADLVFPHWQKWLQA
jgi:lysophospholipase L1-like esterase